jgi:hypothetical protein
MKVTTHMIITLENVHHVWIHALQQEWHQTLLLIVYAGTISITNSMRLMMAPRRVIHVHVVPNVVVETTPQWQLEAIINHHPVMTCSLLVKTVSHAKVAMNVH